MLLISSFITIFMVQWVKHFQEERLSCNGNRNIK